MGCYNVSAEELQTLLNSGWTFLGGPFGSEAECLANCGSSSSSTTSSGTSGTIAVDCCTNLLPEVLYATITGSTGDCGCIEGVYELTYNGGLFAWSTVAGDITTGCSDIKIRISISCDGGEPNGPNPNCANMLLSLTCEGGTANSVGNQYPDSCTCDPFFAFFNDLSLFDAGSRCCTGTFDVIIST